MRLHGLIPERGIAHAAEPVPTSAIPGEGRHEAPMPQLWSDRLSARSHYGRAQAALPEMLDVFPDERCCRQRDRATVEHGCRGARGGSDDGRGGILPKGWVLLW